MRHCQILQAAELWQGQGEEIGDAGSSYIVTGIPAPEKLEESIISSPFPDKIQHSYFQPRSEAGN